MELKNLRVWGVENPIGFFMEKPVLSWTVEGASGQQKSVRVSVRDSGGEVYDSGVVRDRTAGCGDSLGWELDFTPKARTRYDYTLEVVSDSGESAAGHGYFETGKASESWRAKWVTPEKTGGSVVLKKRFALTEEEKQAEPKKSEVEKPETLKIPKNPFVKFFKTEIII